MKQAARYWQAFLKDTGKDAACRYSYCGYFGDTEAVANRLLELILQGKKQATTSCMEAFARQNERVPAVGDYSIVTDWNGTPRCIIQTTRLTLLPFRKMTYAICQREGEDDCLSSWRETHMAFFRAEGNRLGYTFGEDSLILFEDFVVVYRKPL